ncbi:MAG: RNA methyltransferase [Burkholderiales bacterium]|nr:RNA methyltransferase [Burkholderiales bacterium]
MSDHSKSKPAVRARANSIRDFRCKNLVVVLECPEDVRNIGTVIRNVNALGAEKVYVVDERRNLPDDWQEMRDNPKLTRTSASAVKWSFVKRFDTTELCLQHLAKNGFISVVTSPHVKGRKNVSLGSGNYTKHTKLAVWFGNENHGISDTAIHKSDFCINIPMFGMIESLNLATSSGIVLYEVTKQRRAFQARLKAKLVAKAHVQSAA